MVSLQCPTRKQAHASKGAAEAQLRALLKLDEGCRDGNGLYTYLCRCGAWHVGHRIKKGRKV